MFYGCVVTLARVSLVINHVVGYPIVGVRKVEHGIRIKLTPLSQAYGSEYAVHLFWDHKELDVPEGWLPNVSAKSLKLAEMTSDIKYGSRKSSMG